MVAVLDRTKWGEADQIQQICGWSKRTIRRKGASGELPRAETSRGHFLYDLATARAEAERSATRNAATAVDISDDADACSSAPEYARRKVAKYAQLLHESRDLGGSQLTAWVEQYNAAHPDDSTSVSAIHTARRVVRDDGVSALLANYGKRAGITIVPDAHMEHFKSLYLKEGGPGAASCWKATLGWAIQHHKATPAGFPSLPSFIRRLRSELLPESIYRARYGVKMWNRKYASHIRRDYTNVLAGEAWVADHAQIDIAVALPNGKYCFPWVSAWRDFKSGLWLGWTLREQAPSSDPIFTAFYAAAAKHGVCSSMILDNGKDFRCKDFSGGRRTLRVEVDEKQVRSMTAALGIDVTFAWPYNAQTKPIERDFLRNKEWLSKHATGYRGGNVIERPESLNNTIRSGNIETIDDLRAVFDEFIHEVVNNSIVSSGHRAGKCPQEIWDEEAPVASERGLLRDVTTDALKLFCARTSGNMVVGRNGVRDSEYGVDYWDDWMFAAKGTRVYLRRPSRAHETAWVFNAETDDFLGKGHLVQAVPALAKTDIEREQLAEAIRLKRRANKVAREYAKADTPPSLREKVGALVAATRAINDARGYMPADQPIRRRSVILTAMDAVAQKDRDNQERGRHTFALPLPDEIDAAKPRFDPLAPFYEESAAG